MSDVVKDALCPFSGASDPQDTNPPSDFILRTSDGVDFHVHKQILAFFSSLFSDMFACSSSDDLQRDGKPVLQLTEPQIIIHRLLCLAYPGRSRQQYICSDVDLDHIPALHEAAQKYQLVHVERLIVQMLMDDALLAAHPHRLFAIAVLRDIPDLAKKAALRTLNRPVCPLDLAFPEMRLITADVLQNLYAFHRACSAKAEHTLRRAFDDYVDGVRDSEQRLGESESQNWTFTWWYHDASRHQSGCGPDHDQGRAAEWFYTHMEQLLPRLSAVPVGQTALEEIPRVSKCVSALLRTCSFCAPRAKDDLVDIAKQVARIIDKASGE
ncbi:hypothetical protein FB45DRAFT_1141223 [Roridomyces roridus]|uniref:BTB domain-containing protein n=1 Tax=Roridomyces roridus TaxID=1738132 RepID=A0AAD7BYB0_9AGAR|nr:hypothetical protein FB45DRAFT_1141223 [Roridomyces roridus]